MEKEFKRDEDVAKREEEGKLGLGEEEKKMLHGKLHPCSSMAHQAPF